MNFAPGTFADFGNQTKQLQDYFAAEEAKKKALLQQPDTVKAQPAMNADPVMGPRSVSTVVKYDAQGRPIRNDYASLTGQDGKLLEQFRMANRIGDDIKIDPTAMNAIQSRALATGPSAWALMAKDKLALETQNALGKNAREATASMNQGLTSLASRGGASPAMKALLAKQAGRNQFTGAQGLRQQNLMGNLNIDMQDDQTKTGLLTQLPGMQLNQANFDQSQRAYRNQAIDLDNQRAMKDIMGLNAYQADGYKEAMAGWGAERTANAQAAAAGGGGKK